MFQNIILLRSCFIELVCEEVRSSFGMLRHVAHVRILVFLRSLRRLLVTDNVVPPSKTSVLTRTTRRNIPEDDILHNKRRENLKSECYFSYLFRPHSIKLFVCLFIDLLIYCTRLEPSPPLLRQLIGLLYKLWIIVEKGVDWINGKENRNIWRKSAPVPNFPPEIPHELNQAQFRANAVGSRRLTAGATPPQFVYFTRSSSFIWGTCNDRHGLRFRVHFNILIQKVLGYCWLICFRKPSVLLIFGFSYQQLNIWLLWNAEGRAKRKDLSSMAWSARCTTLLAITLTLNRKVETVTARDKSRFTNICRTCCSQSAAREDETQKVCSNISPSD
jgi:hypothetical protein